MGKEGALPTRGRALLFVGQTKLIACATVIEEVAPRLLSGIEVETLETGLHGEPDRLKAGLQAAIDRTDDSIATILLGYGLCAQATVGLRAKAHTLVMPRVDDCIALFLGSCAAYRRQTWSFPGTYFLARGWIQDGINPFDEYDQWVSHYGERKARRIYQAMLGRYRRLALINTGQYPLEPYRLYAQSTAARFDLQWEEIPGDLRLIERLMTGDWNEDFVVVPPGQEVEDRHFLPMPLGEAFTSQSLAVWQKETPAAQAAA